MGQEYNVYLAHIVREYAGILIEKGDSARGEPLMVEAIELFRKHYGNDHITVAFAYENLGWVYIESGELDKAEAAYQQSLDILNRSSEASSSDRIDVLVHLSIVLGEKQKYEEAERLLGQALDLYRTSPTHNELSLGRVLRESAMISYFKHDYATAEEQAKKSIDMVRLVSTGVNLQTELAGSLHTFGLILANAGKPVRAEPYLREALTIMGKINPKGHPAAASTASLLGECLTKQRRYREAEPFLIESYNDLKSTLGEQKPATIEAHQRLVKLYEAWGKPDLAARYRASQ
jgi:tetratricopeptide (TPR) repeat protein